MNDRTAKTHTPGPWGLFGFQDSSTDELRSLCVSQESMPFMRVCFMPSDGTDEIMANARLIAAAPDLLEALILLEREMVLSGNAGSEDYGWKPAIEKTRNAIAKATGSNA